MEVGERLGAILQSIANVVGDPATLLILALIHGLVALMGGLAFIRTTTFVLRRGLRETARYWRTTRHKYFTHLRWMGHTQESCKIAVACGLAAWFGVLLLFALKPVWPLIGVLIAIFVLSLTYEGLKNAGPRGKRRPFRFLRGFYEPTLALTIPALAGKLIDAGLHAVVRF